MIPKPILTTIKNELNRLEHGSHARYQLRVARQALDETDQRLTAATDALMPAAIAWNLASFKDNNIVALNNMRHSTILAFLQSGNDPGLGELSAWYTDLYTAWNNAGMALADAEQRLHRTIAMIATYEAILVPGSVKLEKQSA